MGNPERCPRRESHGQHKARSCSICGWTAPTIELQARKTFHEDSWREFSFEGTLGERCEAPTAGERARWAKEDQLLSPENRFPAITEAPPPGTKVYRVITQRDEFFGGKFDPVTLTMLINKFALDGWRVVAITAADVSTFFGTFWAGRDAREELVVFLEKTIG